MPTRRHLLTGLLTLPALTSAARAGLVTTDDGMPTQSWFLNTFLHLPEDAAEAHAAGRMLAVVWEQKGCPGCRKLHEVNFADSDIAAFARAKFDWLQLNIHGDREVTDLSGTATTEKQAARAARATFTPTIQFIALVDGVAKEVARMPGYLEPREFRLMLDYAADAVWKSGQDFPAYVRSRTGA